MLEAIRKPFVFRSKSDKDTGGLPIIDAPAARVFRALTEEIDAWWSPRLYDAPSTVKLEPHVGGRFYEERDGQTALWAIVRRFEPGKKLMLDGPLGFETPVAYRRSSAALLELKRTDACAKDAARAIAWYRNVLGLEPAMMYPGNRGAEYELADGTTFGLWGGAGDVVSFQPGNGLLFSVEDFDGVIAALKDQGIPIVQQRDLPTCFMAMIADPDGNSVWLHKRKEQPRPA